MHNGGGLDIVDLKMKSCSQKSLLSKYHTVTNKIDAFQLDRQVNIHIRGQTLLPKIAGKAWNIMYSLFLSQIKLNTEIYILYVDCCSIKPISSLASRTEECNNYVDRF